MLRFLSTRFRLALGLSSIAVTIMVIGLALGVVPDTSSQFLRHRAQWCEAMALGVAAFQSTYRSDLLNEYLEAQRSRNPQVHSLAVRSGDDRYLASTIDHQRQWSKASSRDRVSIPLHQDGRLWGTVEIVFRANPQTHGWWAYLIQPWSAMIALVGVGSFLGFYCYLGWTLTQLDPSRSVPAHVRSALDNLTEGLLVLDRNCRIVLANVAFASYLNVTQDSLLGRDPAEFLWQSAEGKDIDEFPWIAAIERNEIVVRQVIQLVRPAAGNLTFHVNCSPIRRGQHPLGVMISFEDITQLEENKRALSVAKAAAEDANQAKSTFLANMSHEIRTPMNAILGFTEMLLRGEVSSLEEQREMLATVHRSGTHLLELINDILDFSKIEAGKLDIERAPFSPYGIVRDVIAVLGIRARQKGVDLRASIPHRLPAQIIADGNRFRQIITNLVGNAVKFTERGEIVVEMTVISAPPQPMLCVRVADTGIGMSPEQLQRLFQPFTQADASIARRFGGTGLGLSISKRLAEGMGGSLTVASQLGRGTVFELRIPTGDLQNTAWHTEAELRAACLQNDQNAKSIVGRLPPARVLVVDDGEPNRRLIRLMLTRAGCQVSEAADGQMALAALSQQSYHLVLMDMQMPVLDGVEATRRLRQRGDSTPIVALTANAMYEDRQRCLQAGCNDFLTKPIQADKLLQTVLAWVENAFPDWAPRETDNAATTTPAAATCSPDNEELARCTFDLSDDDLFDIADAFLDELQNRLSAASRWMEQGEWDSLAAFAHWLKGAGGTCGFPTYSEWGAQLEQSAKSKQSKQARQQLERIAHLTNRSKHFLMKRELVCP